MTAVPVLPSAPPTPAPTLGRPRRAGLRGALEGTPGRLRTAALAAVLAGVVFALLGGSAYQQWSGAMADARSSTAELVRVQTIQNDLVKADAAAANAYLSGGTEATATRTTYDQAVAEAAAALASSTATVDSAEDAKARQEVLQGLAQYTGLVERAKANNLEGLQVGAAYQRQAGTVLRGRIVPALEGIARGDESRVAAAYERANLATVRLIAAGVIALLGLFGVQVWLALRTHRVVNVPLAVATLAIVTALVAGAVTLTAAARRADAAASGPYRTTLALSAARTSAFDAKAQESLGLINRGNASANEAVAVPQIAAATARLDSLRSSAVFGADQLSTAFTAWTAQHSAVRKLDDGGNWVGARDLATGGSNSAFTNFDEVSGSALTTAAGQVDTALASPRSQLQILLWLTVALGLVAAAAGYAGVTQRLGEYR